MLTTDLRPIAKSMEFKQMFSSVELLLKIELEYLFPMADIVTPNLKEASALLGGVQLETVDDMRSAAKSIHDMGPRNVLVKGGDLASSLDAVDILFDGDNFYELHSPRIRTRNTHGTGCTLASCIAAELAKGSLMLSAVKVVHVVKSDSRLANNDPTIALGMMVESQNRASSESVQKPVMRLSLKSTTQNLGAKSFYKSLAGYCVPHVFCLLCC
ncbi:hypothetical protein LOK49_LG13G02343 [Camellia lanceoleosa]|uniref:Uncharacterized protein n=1 Tax=Camellia lanceoleosa TaxID=1840588 RepID=A0ACC0FI02_9ERIC|nr:hypothetical protein LOK49_LG13G02343 [Camellia lanceoleosa]